ncbi:MAG: thiamine-monophosphate kinase [Thermoleophilaceae bacterium]|nr:thiamine-monophosphate kinase [Thermoleophilaceae bacterium]
MAELDLIAAIRRSLGSPPPRVLTGPGDDAAVVRADGVAVTSIDTVVDGVHFQLVTHSPADVGHKALATALSDLAAMGAGPGEAYVSLALPEGFGEARALELLEAMRSLAERQGVALAGGDVVSSPVLAVTVSVNGWSGAADRLVYRSGARAGDVVGVTGELGGSGAGLLLLASDAQPPEREDLIRRHRRPEPLLATGLALAAAGASAMIDLSDGLATDAGHLARASGVKLELSLARLPIAPGVESVASDAAEFAATAGDDYELLFTAPAEQRAAMEAAAQATGTSVSWLGDVRPGGGLVELHAEDGRVVDLSGYQHG